MSARHGLERAHRAPSVLAVALVLLSGCVRYLEPDDPPGRYRAQGGQTLVLHKDGRYERTSGGSTQRGTWEMRAGCSAGLDRITLTPAGENVPPEQLLGGEGWFHSVEIYDGDLVFERE